MQRYFLIVWMCLLACSCGEGKKSAKDQNQMQRVLAIHDEVMPKMSTIGKLVAELKPRLDTAQNKEDYEEAMTDLQGAHTAMMEWMQGFGNRFDSEEILEGKTLTKEKQQWLDEEEVKVKALKKLINESIARAEALLESE